MIVSLVDISIGPGVNAIALLSILLKLALVLFIAVSFPPYPIAMLFTLLKLTFIGASVFPKILS